MNDYNNQIVENRSNNLTHSNYSNSNFKSPQSVPPPADDPGQPLTFSKRTNYGGTAPPVHNDMYLRPGGQIPSLPYTNSQIQNGAQPI